MNGIQKDNKIEGMEGKSTKWNDVCKNTFYITQITQDELVSSRIQLKIFSVII